jgi:hypothetical protein
VSFTESLANAILGVDTLWGGDVMCPSGTGRFIADSWFSDEPLPLAYTHPAAAAVRAGDRAAVEAYLAAVDIRGAIDALDGDAYVRGLALCLRVMWDLAMEHFGKGAPVPYERCVRASTGQDPTPSDPKPKRERVSELLDRRGFADAAAWRRTLPTPMETVETYGAQVIDQYDRLSERHLVPYLPEELHAVPRAKVRFLPIADAWFSGSMNYIGRPAYEATYEINSSLEISQPEFAQLVSHEVAPGHVTTFAYLQNLYLRKKVGFEATVLTMNTRAATLFEGIANNAILIAHGVTEIEQLPDDDLQTASCWRCCRTMPRISRPILRGRRACRRPKSPKS